MEHPPFCLENLRNVDLCLVHLFLHSWLMISLNFLTAFLFKNFQIFEDIDKDRNGVITRKEPLGKQQNACLAGETPETQTFFFLFLIPVVEGLDPQHSALHTNFSLVGVIFR